MRSWTTAVAVAAGVALGAVAAGAYGVVDHGRTGPAPAGAQTADTTTAAPRRITVSATGSVSGRPDLLTISMGVQSDGDTASAALDRSNAAAARLIATLKAAGVADVDITTSDVNLWPRYDTNGKQILGYQSGNSVTAKLRDLSKAGAVIDAAAKSVGDDIRLGGLGFSIENTGPLYAKARQLAVAQARAQADQLAQAAGVQVGRVLEIGEVAQQTPMPYAASGRDAAGAAPASVPLQPGSQTLELQVSVTYELT